MADSRPQIDAEIARRMAVIESMSHDDVRVRMELLRTITRVETKQDYFQMAFDRHLTDDFTFQKEMRSDIAAVREKNGAVTSSVTVGNAEQRVALRIGSIIAIFVGWIMTTAIAIWAVLKK